MVSVTEGAFDWEIWGFDFKIRISGFPIKHEILFQDGNPFLDFVFYWEIRNPKSEIEIQISQSKAPRKLDRTVLSKEPVK